MKVTLTNDTCTVTREATDAKLYSESLLLHRVKQMLNAQGHDLIKKLAWKDGHMIADTQHYLRSRNPNRAGSIAIWDSHYAIRNACEDYNAGAVTFAVER